MAGREQKARINFRGLRKPVRNMFLCIHRLHRGLRFFGIAPVSQEVPEVASDGDLRESPGFTCEIDACELIYRLLLTASLKYTHSWSHLFGNSTSPFQRTDSK